MRGQECRRAKGEDAFRIVVLGSSVSFGYGVAEEDTYARQLEDLFKARCRGHEVEVLNLAVVGHNFVQRQAVLRDKALALDPDLVIMMFEGWERELGPPLEVDEHGFLQ